MTDNSTQVPNTPTPPEGGTGDGQPAAEPLNTGQAGHTIPKSRFDEVNERRKALEAQLAEMQAARDAEETERLAEQNQWKELAEKRAAQLAELERAAQQRDAYASAIQATNTQRMDALPEAVRALAPDYADDPVRLSAWLDRAEGFSPPDAGPPPPPNADGPAGNQRKHTPALSPGQQAAIDLARASGYSVDEEQVAGRLGTRNSNTP